jgi:hypothetical protein
MTNELSAYLDYLIEFARTNTKKDMEYGSKPLSFLDMSESENLEGTKLYELVLELIKKINK